MPDESFLSSLKRAVAIIDGNEWTTTPPTEPGWYWAYENELPEDADVMMVYVADKNGALVPDWRGMWFRMQDFTHWIGPLKKPPAPE